MDIDALGNRLFVIAGPCVIESYDICASVAQVCRDACEDLGVDYVFKASYDKANRSSLNSFRGPGIEEGLKVLSRIKREFDVPILTDVHSPEEARDASEVVDILQVPAFLCRQTDLLVAAGSSGRIVNIKKGQFMAPWDMRYAVEKVRSAGGDKKVILTERGTFFGYNNLVNDMRSLVIMKDIADLVVFDATHSVQLPGAGAGCSAGNREYIPYLARAAAAVGIDGIFFEVHPNPERALCDGANSLKLVDFPGILGQVRRIYEFVKEVHK